MKKSFVAISIIALICVLSFSKDEIAFEKKLNSAHFFQHKKPKNPAPNDYWYQVRSYPYGFNQTEYLQKMELIKMQIEEMSFDRTANLDLPWLQEGPGNIEADLIRWQCIRLIKIQFMPALVTVEF
ncbi:MAG: hypothetical protein IPO32_19365 [Crocinitomicaceae bacterium]|nr:hypothetical protein [Crocinitomicaceae bacterium]